VLRHGVDHLVGQVDAPDLALQQVGPYILLLQARNGYSEGGTWGGVGRDGVR